MEQQNFLQSIAYALPRFAHPNASEQSVYDALIAYGIDSSVADRIVIFTPTAFGRILMRHLALAFPSSYRIQNEAGQLASSQIACFWLKNPCFAPRCNWLLTLLMHMSGNQVFTTK